MPLTKNGKVAGIKFRKCLSVKNAEGRFAPTFDDNETTEQACSTILFSIGQKPDYGKLFEGTKVARVNTMNLDGKTKRRGMTFGKTAKQKKAIVFLTEDSKDIEIFTGL